MNKVIRISLIGILSLAIMACMTGAAQAAITIGATSAVSDGVLTLRGADDSILTVATAGKDLTLSVSAGGAQQLILASGGTGADALTITTTLGGIDIQAQGSQDGEDLDITTVGATTEMRLTSASTDEDSIDIVSAGGIDIAAVDNIDFILTADADGEDFLISQAGALNASLVLTSAGTSSDAIDINAAAGVVDVDALGINLGGGTTGVVIASASTSADAIIIIASAGGGGIDITSNTGAIDIESSTSGVINIGAAAQAGAINIGTGASARTITIGNDDNSTKVDINAITIDLDACGAVNIDATSSLSLNTIAGEDILIGNDAVTQDILLGNTTATEVDATAVVVDINGGITGVTIDALDAGKIDIGVSADAASDVSAINIGTSATLRTITIGNAASTKVDVNAIAIELDAEASGVVISSASTTADAIIITTSAGGIDIISSGTAAGEDIDISTSASVNVTSTEGTAGAITLNTDGGAAETIVVTNTQGTGAGAITLISTVGGIAMHAKEMLTLDVATGTAATADIILTNTVGTGAAAIAIKAVAGGIEIDAAASKIIDIETGAGGTIKIGTDAAAQTITIGNVTGATAINLDGGSPATGGGVTVTGTTTLESAVNYALAATGNNIAYTLAVGIGALTDGQVVIFKMPATACDGGTVATLNVNSLTAKNMIRGTDGASHICTTTKDLGANGTYMAIYNSTSDSWVVLGE